MIQLVLLIAAIVLLLVAAALHHTGNSYGLVLSAAGTALGFAALGWAVLAHHG